MPQEIEHHELNVVDSAIVQNLFEKWTTEDSLSVVEESYLARISGLLFIFIESKRTRL